MGEDIRFYWPGNEARVPMANTAVEDRDPLQFRIGEIREHAPAAVQALEQGRYVAVAWRGADGIRLIACHPALASKPPESVCLNLRELPNVALQLQHWDEAPEATQVLLAAYGAEGQDREDCDVARRALSDWLKEHGQPEMAGVVENYFTHPSGYPPQRP